MTQFLTESSASNSHSSFLWEHSRRPEWTPLQRQVDGLVRNLFGEEGHLRTLSVLTAATAAGRLTRLGWGALPLGAVSRSPVVSWTLGVGSEAVAYEGANRVLLTLSQPSAPSPQPSLWRWGGPGGWKEGLSISGIQFTLLHGAGFMAQGQNIVFQHSLQSSALVAGNRVAGTLGWIPAPEGTTAEQFFKAETLNIELGAVMGLGGLLIPQVTALEASLGALSNKERLPPFFLGKRFQNLFPEALPEGAFRLPEGKKESPFEFSQSKMSIKDDAGSGSKEPLIPNSPEALREKLDEAETHWIPYLKTADETLQRAVNLYVGFINRWIMKGKDERLSFSAHEKTLLENFIADTRTSLEFMSRDIQALDQLRFGYRRAGLAIPKELGELSRTVKQTHGRYQRTLDRLEKRRPLLDNDLLNSPHYFLIRGWLSATSAEHPEWQMPTLTAFAQTMRPKKGD